MTLREVVTEFCLMGDRVEALEAINDLIRAERTCAHAEGLEAGLRLAAQDIEDDYSIDLKWRVLCAERIRSAIPSEEAK